MTLATSTANPAGTVRSWPVFLILTFIFLWLAHALAFFPHEYGHSFTAWILGWKENPLDLNYGHPHLVNWLIQSDIDENVNYEPIFASGHDHQAGIIAAAGMLVGNMLITYTVSRWGFSMARQKEHWSWALFFYWLCLDSVGNFIDYVPARTFSGKGDMHTLAMGFHCSPWWIMIVLGIPSAVLFLHFLFRFLPQSLDWLFPDSPGKKAMTLVLSAFMLFGFYGFAGWSGAGPVSHSISAASIFIFLPATLIVGLWRLISKRDPESVS